MPSSSDKTPRTAAPVLISSEAHLVQQMETFRNPIAYLTSRVQHMSVFSYHLLPCQLQHKHKTSTKKAHWLSTVKNSSAPASPFTHCCNYEVQHLWRVLIWTLQHLWQTQTPTGCPLEAWRGNRIKQEWWLLQFLCLGLLEKVVSVLHGQAQQEA